MGEDLEEFLVKVKPVKLLINLRRETTPNYASELSNQIDATYSHTVKVLQRMEKLGLVENRKEGRKKIIDLTDKGDRIAEKCSALIKTISKE